MAEEEIRGRQRGLVGGDPRIKAGVDKGAVIEHPFFLDVLRYPEDGEALRDFLSFSQSNYLEIGFGRGLFLAELARMYPKSRVLGVEVRKGLCFSGLQRLDKAGLENGRVVLGDVRALWGSVIPLGTFDGVFVMFPDPWWKKKHHKKRLLEAGFLRELVPALRSGATVLVRSDVPLVIELAQEAMAHMPEMAQLSDAPYPTPETDRERVCRTLGTPVDEVWYRYEPQEAQR